MYNCFVVHCIGYSFRHRHHNRHRILCYSRCYIRPDSLNRYLQNLSLLYILQRIRLYILRVFHSHNLRIYLCHTLRGNGFRTFPNNPFLLQHTHRYMQHFLYLCFAHYSITSNTAMYTQQLQALQSIRELFVLLARPP
uniref:Uncharacterized protein n=1 Tax=Ackermannviridae sp. TaxID=2831612 RepID=A0A8S5VVZ1_9CAUD|nr:MAG TPA: hypothetical protein [Ackermannviridae sp.]